MVKISVKTLAVLSLGWDQVFLHTMKMAGNCIYFLLPVLTLSCYSDAAGHNTWPELGGGVLPLKLLQTRLSEVWSNLSVPFPIWNLNLRRSFNLRLMNCESLR